MTKVAFRNRREVRMGSPHQTCRMQLSGDWQPRLELDDWQDLQAQSPDGRYLALVRWDTRGNTPGFRIVDALDIHVAELLSLASADSNHSSP